MNETLKASKAILRQFMQDHYTDERLTMLLDHSRKGSLAYGSCCCFIGSLTAPHVLRGRDFFWRRDNASCAHYQQAERIQDAKPAESAFRDLALPIEDKEFMSHDEWERSSEPEDQRRRARLIPMILAEIRRRSWKLRDPAKASPIEAHI